MARMGENLWSYNVARLVVIDVTDDYRLMQPPLPSDCYPVLTELWVPVYRLKDHLKTLDLVDGYLYDWHESPQDEAGAWYVGVVDSQLTVVGRG